MKFRLIEDYLLFEEKNTRIFNIDRTGMSDYDEILSNDTVREYLQNEKNRSFDICYMTPDEYITRCSNLLRMGYDELIKDKLMDADTIEYLKKQIESGVKLNMPVIDYTRGKFQEGLHRMVTVGELYGYTRDTYPVLIGHDSRSNTDDIYANYYSDDAVLPQELLDAQTFTKINAPVVNNYELCQGTDKNIFVMKKVYPGRNEYDDAFYFDTTSKNWYNEALDKMVDWTDEGGLDFITDPYTVTAILSLINYIPSMSDDFKRKVENYCELPKLIYCDLIRDENGSQIVNLKAYVSCIENVENIKGSDYTALSRIRQQLRYCSKIVSDVKGGDTLVFENYIDSLYKTITEVDLTNGNVKVSFKPNGSFYKLQTVKIGKDCTLIDLDKGFGAWAEQATIYISKQCKNYANLIDQLKEYLQDCDIDTTNMGNQEIFDEAAEFIYIKFIETE